MSHRRRTGFTLVELLVVITIIGMLMALLLPAVNAAVEAGRNTQCKNNIRQLALALDAYENLETRYPGYENPVKYGTGESDVYLASWVVEILPQLDRIDLYDAWYTSTNPLPDNVKPYLELMVCPSDPPDSTTDVEPLAYVANSGFYSDSGSGNAIANGIFHSVSGPVSNSDTIIDGKTYTVCFSENIQATEWDLNTLEGNTSEQIRYETTMMWYPGVNINPPDKANLTAGLPENARPSSFHTGGVNVAFCDTHVIFLSNVDENVYIQLLTTNHKESDAPDKTHILDEGTLK